MVKHIANAVLALALANSASSHILDKKNINVKKLTAEDELGFGRHGTQTSTRTPPDTTTHHATPDATTTQAAATTVPTQAPTNTPYPHNGANWETMGVYIEYGFDWSAFDTELMDAIDNGYTDIYIGFYMSLHGCQAACTAWQTLDSGKRQNVINYANQNGAAIYMAVGGPGESPEYAIAQGADYVATYAQNAAKFAANNEFMGMEFCIHLAGEETIPSIYAQNGSLIDYAQTLTSQGRNYFAANRLIISGQAPYFSEQFLSPQHGDDPAYIPYTLSYLAFNTNQAMPWYVSRINMLMFNEDEAYDTYNDMFIDNEFEYAGWDTFGAGSAVLQVASLGVPANSISVTKPILPGVSAYKTGYCTAATLGMNWGCQARNRNGFNWRGGFVGWTWTTDDAYSALNWPTDLGIQYGGNCKTVSCCCSNWNVNSCGTNPSQC